MAQLSVGSAELAGFVETAGTRNPALSVRRPDLPPELPGAQRCAPVCVGTEGRHSALDRWTGNWSIGWYRVSSSTALAWPRSTRKLEEIDSCLRYVGR